MLNIDKSKVDTGIKADRISRDFIVVNGNAIYKIIDTALTGNFGTIVVDRREVISFAQEHFWGVSVKKSLNRSTIWTIRVIFFSYYNRLRDFYRKDTWKRMGKRLVRIA